MGKGGEGGEGKIPIIYFPPPQPLPRLCTNRLPVKHPVTIQDGGNPDSVFRSEITPALQATLNIAGVERMRLRSTLEAI